MMSKILDGLSNLKEQLSLYHTAENKKRITVHIWFFKKILLKYPELYKESQHLLEDVCSILVDDYWLHLEIKAQEINVKDDSAFRRCLFHFANAIKSEVTRPSIVCINQTSIDLLYFYRKSVTLGRDINLALNKWDSESKLARSTTLFQAHEALNCLKILCESSTEISDSLCRHGLSFFKSTMNYRKIFAAKDFIDRKKSHKKALFYILQSFDEDRFLVVNITINGKELDVTDLASISPEIIKQLQLLADSDKFKGLLEHQLNSLTSRFMNNLSTIRTIFSKNPSDMFAKGLDSFLFDDFYLLKHAKKHLKNNKFAELLLLIEQHCQRKIYPHDYFENRLEFFFQKNNNFRSVNISDIYDICPKLADELIQFHRAETKFLSEKNYDMETLHTRFSKLKRLLLNYIVPDYKNEIIKNGLLCLGMNGNFIQKSVFGKIQSEIKSKKISIRTGASYIEVIRWLMSNTGQDTVEAFKISYKKHQRHARRLKVEDLYTDEELKELIYYIELGIREKINVRQLIALYFARIQVKSCWNTSPMSDIELSDISEISLPTHRNNISVLIQKPRKGYGVDKYHLDGRAANSVMRDIIYVRDSITSKYRNLGDDVAQKFLFIYKDKSNVERVNACNIISQIKAILKRLGCRVAYNSMRIRKNGSNHLYLAVAKQINTYESVKLHSFDTFINNYQRISEHKTQQTLHAAVDVMQRYFTGREIDPEIRILMRDSETTQKTPTGECASQGADNEALQYIREHRHLPSKKENALCSDFLACVWCKHFRTVADPEHVWQLLSYRDYVLSDMAASVSDIENNEFQIEAIDALKQRVNDILAQVEAKNAFAVTKGRELMAKNGMHQFWAFAITAVKNTGKNI